MEYDGPISELLEIYPHALINVGVYWDPRAQRGRETATGEIGSLPRSAHYVPSVIRTYNQIIFGTTVPRNIPLTWICDRFAQ